MRAPNVSQPDDFDIPGHLEAGAGRGVEIDARGGGVVRREIGTQQFVNREAHPTGLSGGFAGATDRLGVRLGDLIYVEVAIEDNGS